MPTARWRDTVIAESDDTVVVAAEHDTTADVVTILDEHLIPETHAERIAIIGGSALVAGLGGWLAKSLSYVVMYWISLIIPLISVAGVVLAKFTQMRSPSTSRLAGLVSRSSKQIPL